MNTVSAFVRIDDEEGSPWYVRVDSIFAIKDDPDQTVVYFSGSDRITRTIKSYHPAAVIFERMRDVIENNEEV